MVTSGTNKRTEVIDIVDPTRTCSDKEDFPIVNGYQPLGGVVNNEIIVCARTTCYKMENGPWSKIDDHSPQRGYASGIVVKGDQIFLKRYSLPNEVRKNELW